MEAEYGLRSDRGPPRTGRGGASFGFPTGGSGSAIPIPLPGKAGGGLGGIIVFVVLFLLFSGVLGGSGSIPGSAGCRVVAPSNRAAPWIPRATPTNSSPTSSTTSRRTGRPRSAVRRDYPETKLVLFDGSTQSACGPASAATGPFYCPADQKVYLDLGFMDELKSRFGAKGGDFAMAYVVAHEFGHHIQTALGISDQVQQIAQQDPSRRNDLSVRQELQADCLAGVWAHSDQADLEAGDIEEALSAAAAVGDDRIQAVDHRPGEPRDMDARLGRATGRLVHHGYKSGNSDDCDTFAQ